MNNNQHLFFYGLGAKGIQFLGYLILIAAFIALGLGDTLWFGGITLVVAIAVIFYGKSMRFDYQMQSGNIIHRGDW